MVHFLGRAVVQMGCDKFYCLVRGLPADSIIRVCLYLGYKDCLNLAALSASFYLLVTGHVPRSEQGLIQSSTSGPRRFTDNEKRRLLELHNNLWRALCVREGATSPSPSAVSARNKFQLRSSLRQLYETTCSTFYLLELAAPGARQDFFVCKSIAHVRETLIKEFQSEDDSRMLIQHLCRLGLDICLYAVYKDLLISVTPLYEALTIQIGSNSILTLKYLGGIENEDQCDDAEVEDNSTAESSTSTPSPKVLLESQGVWKSARECAFIPTQDTEIGTLKRLHTFFRQGRNCRYQVTHWAQDDQVGIADPNGGICVQCPPSLFCDIVFLPITPVVDEDFSCQLNIAGAPLRRDTVDIQVPKKLISVGPRRPDHSFILRRPTSRSYATLSYDDSVTSPSLLPDTEAADDDDEADGPEVTLLLKIPDVCRVLAFVKCLATNNTQVYAERVVSQHADASWTEPLPLPDSCICRV